MEKNASLICLKILYALDKLPLSIWWLRFLKSIFSNTNCLLTCALRYNQNQLNGRQIIDGGKKFNTLRQIDKLTSRSAFFPKHELYLLCAVIIDGGKKTCFSRLLENFICLNKSPFTTLWIYWMCWKKIEILFFKALNKTYQQKKNKSFRRLFEYHRIKCRMSIFIYYFLNIYRSFQNKSFLPVEPHQI